MRKTTKIISLLLTFAMMLTMVLPMTVSAAFTDVPASHHYYDAITNLSAEGILNGFEDGSFKPGDPVTRAQFTKIICYALSVGNLTYSTEEKSIFTDLAPEHWAADNIVTAYKQGIINGMGDGTFAPEAGVQYEQAVKMVVCALGYGNRALSLGEYPIGYMTMASQLKLLKGITDAKMYEVMSRGAVAQLIDNMLDTDQNVGGEQGGSIREEVGSSKKVEGQVVAGYGVALYEDAELEACEKNAIIIETNNEVKVAYDVSEIKNFDIYEFLGRSVTVYYEEETGVSAQVLSSIALQAKKNETTKIELDMIYYCDDSTIEYYTDADRTDTETVTYQTDSYNLWNGQPTSDNVQTLLGSYGEKAGYITLVSSEANQSADVAFLKTYETIVVEVVDKKNYKISAKNVSGNYVLDVTDKNKNITITMNGNDYAFSSINTNDILSISESANGKVIDVLVSTKVVTGKIISMSTESPTQIKLDTGNTIYTVSPEVYNGGTNHSGPEAIAELQAGDRVTISLDAFGKVARFIVSAGNSYSYGYISALEHGTSSKPEIGVKIYRPGTSNVPSEWELYPFAEKVKIDGKTYNVEEKMQDILDCLRDSANEANEKLHTDFAKVDNDPLDDDEATDYAQPVRFALNGSKIEAILTVNSGDPTTNSSTELEIVDETSEDGIECTVDGTKFGQYVISSSTPVLYIPTDRSSNSYSAKSNGFFDQGYKYFVQFANVSAINTVGCVYLYGVKDSDGNSSDVTAKITEENKPLIILEKSQKIHNGNTETCIKVMDVTTGDVENAPEYFENSVDLDTLSVGDVVLLAIGINDYVDELFVLAKASEIEDFKYEGNVCEKIYGNTSGENADFRTIIATVTYKESSSFVVTRADSATPETIIDKGSLPIYMVDENANGTNKVKPASMIDVVAGARVLVYTVKGNAEAVIIFVPKTTND